MGLYNPAVGVCNFPGQPAGEAGDVCFISQSGTHMVNMAFQGPMRGIKINKGASIVQLAIALNPADYLEMMAEDAGTRVIGMYVEGIRDGWLGEPAGLEADWFALASLRTPAPKRWMDAYLCAFARSVGADLVTFDRGYLQFEGDALKITLLA